MKKTLFVAGAVMLALACALFSPGTKSASAAPAYVYPVVTPQTPAVPGVPVLAAMPAGGDGICARATAAADLVVTCDAATPCYYRQVTSFGAADGGFPTVKGGNGTPDGGFANAGADNYLIAKTPVSMRLTGTNDSVCATTADGGSLTLGIRSH